MFDAFVMVEGYCNLLFERVALIENQKLVSFLLLFIFGDFSHDPCFLSFFLCGF